MMLHCDAIDLEFRNKQIPPANNRRTDLSNVIIGAEIWQQILSWNKTRQYWLNLIDILNNRHYWLNLNIISSDWFIEMNQIWHLVTVHAWLQLFTYNNYRKLKTHSIVCDAISINYNKIAMHNIVLIKLPCLTVTLPNQIMPSVWCAPIVFSAKTTNFNAKAGFWVYQCVPSPVPNQHSRFPWPPWAKRAVWTMVE